MRLTFFISSCLICILFVVGCARKQKNIYDFSKKEKIKIKKLDLPAVKGFEIEKKAVDAFLFWQGVEKKNKDCIFIGYNIYKFSDVGFIPKKPLNRDFIADLFFVDKNILGKNCYLVRAVFRFKNKILQGPASQIIYV